MAITTNDIQYRRGVTHNVADPATNGGPLGSAVIPANTRNALFPNVTTSERTSGVNHLAKVFACINTPDTQEALNPKFFMFKPSTAGSIVSLMVMAKSAVQTALDIATGRRYGCGSVAVEGAAGANSITVTLEDADVIANGDNIRLTTQSEIGGAGVVEYNTVTSKTPSGSNYVLGLGSPLSATYPVGSFLSAYLTVASLKAALGVVTKSSAAGTFTSANVVITNTGCYDETFTLTFTSATAYTVTSATHGVNTTGTTASTKLVNHPLDARVMLQIPPSFFSGTWAAGDTVTIPTVSAAMPVGVHRKIPAGTAPSSADNYFIGFDFESA